MAEAWLTEILLPKRRHHASRDSGHVHRWLTKAADGPWFLWVQPRPGMIIVQSPAPLDRAILSGASSVHAARIQLHHEKNTRLEISGIVAPTKAEHRQGQRGKIRALPPDQHADWVTRKLTPALAQIEQLTIQQLSPTQGTKTDDTRLLHPRSSIHLYGTVKAPDTLTELLSNGVGRGKRFGTGLLLAKAA